MAWRNDPRFSKILDPKRIGRLSPTKLCMKLWQRELNAIIVQARQPARTVTDHEGKEVGKGHKLQPPLRYAVPMPGDMEFEEDDIAWATRSGMWQGPSEKASARRTKRAKAASSINSRWTQRVAAH